MTIQVKMVVVGTETPVLVSFEIAVCRVMSAVLVPLQTAFTSATLTGRFCAVMYSCCAVEVLVHPVTFASVAVTDPIAVMYAMQALAEPAPPLQEVLLVGAY